jgi:hypothetical protein
MWPIKIGITCRCLGPPYRSAPELSVREANMRSKKSTNVILLVALGTSLVVNIFVLLRTTILKSEYSWLRNTYETHMIGAYKDQGIWMAQMEHLRGNPKEYVLDTSSPTMGIAVENFHSHTPTQAGSTDLLWRIQRMFTKSQKREPEQIWHVNLKNRGLEAFVTEHNDMLSRLIERDPNKPLQ